MTSEALDAFCEALVDDDAESLYEQAPCGYLSTSPDGLIVKVNQTFLTLTGFERDELVARRTFADLLSAGGRIYQETHLAPMLHMGGSAREIALDIVCADGSRLPVLVNAVLVRDDDGHPLVIRTAVFDATARREYERELLRAKHRAEESETRARVLARTLQQTLIPPDPPAIPGLEVAAAYRPAGNGEEVGGDFYDVFEVATDDWFVVVGDVRGKGVDAAVVTALARYTIRAEAVRNEQPSAVLLTLNDVLLRHATDRFCTVALVHLRRRDDGWGATISLGGHDWPLLVRAGEQPVEVGEVGSLLGMFEDVHLADVEVELRSGDALVVLTDGVSEGRGDGELYGEERLLDSVARNAGSAGSITYGVLDEIMAFQDGNASDDIAIVTLQVP